jgi:hypothetical protein
MIREKGSRKVERERKGEQEKERGRGRKKRESETVKGRVPSRVPSRQDCGRQRQTTLIWEEGGIAFS